MAKNPLPTPEQLRQLLRYEASTGKLYWRERGPEWCSHPLRGAEKEAARWNKQFAGTEAGTSHSNGYKKIHILGRRIFAHRIVYAMHKGRWPEVTDHINGARDDNRIENLRSVTSEGNMRNVNKPKNNTSGRSGVVWHKARKKWAAQIKVRGAVIYLGVYADKAEAIKAREAAEMKYGFSERHGR